MVMRRRVYYVRRWSLLGLLTIVLWAVAVVVVAGSVVAAWPLVIAAGWGYLAAWSRGWPPRRLAGAALLGLPMLAVFVLIAWADAGAHGWRDAALAPYDAWLASWHALRAGNVGEAAALTAPAAIPAGLALGALAWRVRIGMMAAGAAGWSPAAPVAFDDRQWRRQSRTARQRVAAPGGVPLLSRQGDPVLGAVIRAVGHRPRPVLAVPYSWLRAHMVIVGTTGSGKTTALIRLWAGWQAAAMRRYRAGREARPWLAVIDAKGGFDSRDTAEMARRVLADQGARLVVWPDEVSFDLWALPAGRLAEVLADLVPVAAEGAAAYYTDVLVSVVRLAVGAPGGPPASSADFLARLDERWLASAYAGIPDQLARIRAAQGQLGDVRLRFESLFARLGPGFDGDAAITDFDAVYCIVEGTASTSVGEAQALALTELVADVASRWGRDGGGERRAGLLALDEFSAVARRVPLHELTERCRSLGLAVQVAAQSWEGLAPEEDERVRLASTAAGGVLVMRCPAPDAVCRLAGTRRVIEVGRKIVGPRGRYGDEGTGRIQYAWTVDPDRVRDFTVGQAAYIRGNAATYLQVAPYRRSPLALPAPKLEPVEPGSPELPLTGPEPEPGPFPPPGPGLDDVFGGGR